MAKILFFLFFPLTVLSQEQKAWIRINQLGFTPDGTKVAVWCSKDSVTLKTWQLIDVATKKVVLSARPGKAFGAYGPFKQTYRLNFSSIRKEGTYYVQAGSIKSPEFRINKNVYAGTADFCLRYMRQQRTGFNPFLKDSCHTQDGYTLYAEKAGMPDSTRIDVVGGWHDASDYLQYSTTSANATTHLLMAYRDFPNVFADSKQANGLDGKNGIADVLDEARWGLKWLLKMFPKRNIMFNQIADDRDHISMRIPKMDTQYGRGAQRPVYFVSGEPQQRGKFMNHTTGTSSTAAKFASAFALAEYIYLKEPGLRRSDAFPSYYSKAFDALEYAKKKPGVMQTASVRSPYIYAEENWVDDMELANATIHTMVINTVNGGDNGYYMGLAVDYAKKEKITPWMGDDTAKHYQWYPFINLGHYELGKQLKSKEHGPTAAHSKSYIETFFNNYDTVAGFYEQGIQKVWNRASSNAFYRGIPYIWCSNNLTVSFAMQCYWYKQLTGDKKFAEFEQANFDWLFGCNPWGTSMVYGLPQWGDTPVDPHSAFTHLKNYPIDGGLVDGPVYTNIYKNLIGIQLYQPDEYETFQSDLAVYHDDYGDYSTNEPTMDGTASLIYLLAAKESESSGNAFFKMQEGAIIRGDTSAKKLSLVFTGDEYSDGAKYITDLLQKEKVKASFFLTGRFYNNPVHKAFISQLKLSGHYLGAHSNDHLLYADWNKRDSLLVTKKQFEIDLKANYAVMQKYGIAKKDAPYFLPPYEWYNDSIAKWTDEMGLRLINFTPGTLSPADYTWPELKNYRSSEEIMNSIVIRETGQGGLKGYILLMHIGTDPKRTDKFYFHIPKVISLLRSKGYQFQRIDELLR